MRKLNFLFLLVAVCCLTMAGYFGGRALSRLNPVSYRIPATIKAQAPPQQLACENIKPIENNQESDDEEETEIVTITDKNMVAMDQAFDDASVTTVMVQLQKISDESPKDSIVYLVLNSPGGSVDSGMRLIDFAKALPIKIKTITLFSASMAFQTVQNLDERLIIKSGTLMSHRAKFGVQGEAPGELFSRIKWVMSMIEDLEHKASKRMGMSFKEYQTLIADEYWVYGKDAVKDHAADKAVFVKCGEGLSGKTKTENVETIFGTFQVELSKCPLIPGLISVKAPANATQESKDYVKKMIEDRRAFVRDFVVTNKISSFQK